MKIKVKQVWDMKPPKSMTLVQVKAIADAVHKEGDEFYIAHDNNGDFVLRRVSQ